MAVNYVCVWLMVSFYGDWQIQKVVLVSPVDVLNCPSKPVYPRQRAGDLWAAGCSVSAAEMWGYSRQPSETKGWVLHLFLIISGIGSAALGEVRGQRLCLILARCSSHKLHYLPEAKTLLCLHHYNYNISVAELEDRMNILIQKHFYCFGV